MHRLMESLFDMMSYFQDGGHGVTAAASGRWTLLHVCMPPTAVGAQCRDSASGLVGCLQFLIHITFIPVMCRGGEKLEFVPASSQLLFTPTSVEVVVDSGYLRVIICCLLCWRNFCHFFLLFCCLCYFSASPIIGIRIFSFKYQYLFLFYI